jgi:hypothetical protein
MEWIDSAVAVALGLLLRVGIPVLVTVLLVRWLRGLDERWRTEAEALRSHTEGAAQVKNIGCWEIKGCSAEQQAACQAYAQHETPCWQVLRTGDGHLQERCLGCEVFRKSPAPVPITTT